VERLQRDRRIGVRRALAGNAHTTAEWVDETAQYAASTGDCDLFDQVAPRLPLRRLVELTFGQRFSTGWVNQSLPAALAAASPADRRYAADVVVAHHENPSEVHGRAGKILSGIARAPLGELTQLVEHLPVLAGPLVVSVLGGRHIDVELATLCARYAREVDELLGDLAGTLRPRSSGITMTSVDPLAVPVLLAADSRHFDVAVLRSAAASLTADQVDRILAHPSITLTYEVAAAGGLALTEAQADLVAHWVAQRAETQIDWRGYGSHRRPFYDSDPVRKVLQRDHPWTSSTLLSLLRLGEWPITATWLRGEGPRPPRPGEVTALLADPGRSLSFGERRFAARSAPEELLDLAITARAEGWPWAVELEPAISLDLLRNQRVLSSSTPGIQVVAERLAVIAGDTAEAWATSVALVTEWPGGIDDLARTAVAVSH
jgi:hypothetical protein